MDEDTLKIILSKYQQKSFELFNSNIVLETQVDTLSKQINSLTVELDKLKKSKKTSRATEQEFE
jgi:hypothetical protein